MKDIEPHHHVVAAGTRLWHVYFRGGTHPRPWDDFRAYGPIATARFDHHEPPPHVQDRHIYYAGSSGPMCLLEVFQARRTINRRRNEPWLAGFALRRDVTLLNLTGTWTTRAGASMAINTGNRSRPPLVPGVLRRIPRHRRPMVRVVYAWERAGGSPL